MIEGYTREAGVRSLERSIGKICRKAAKILVSGQAKSVAVTPENLKDYLGPRRFKEDVLQRQDEVGVVNGLAGRPCRWKWRFWTATARSS